MIRLHKGTRKAKVRMGELRARKRFLHKQALIVRWAYLAKRPQSDWWEQSGLQCGCGQEASIAWLSDAIQKLEATTARAS